MLKSLNIENLTVFSRADLEFGKNLNIIIGENGLGKTHLLKAAYAGIAASAAAHFSKNSTDERFGALEMKRKVSGVFQSESLLNLIHRRKDNPDYHLNNRLSLAYKFNNPQWDLSFGADVPPFLETVSPEMNIPQAYVDTLPVFLPTRELLTIYPGFVSLYETTRIPFEETWRDTCLLLGAPLVRGSRESKVKELLLPLEEVMGGRLELDDSGRFYLHGPIGKVEMHLLAEGFRKLAMIARLIATGALLEKGYLFWDEPESNLNPRIIKTIAKTILQVAANGIQVFIATHSLYLLRELHILQKKEFRNLDTRCIGLHMASDGAVSVQQGKTMDDVGSITALDEDLQQSERYIDTEMGVPVNDINHDNPTAWPRWPPSKLIH